MAPPLMYVYRSFSERFVCGCRLGMVTIALSAARVISRAMRECHVPVGSSLLISPVLGLTGSEQLLI